MWCNILLKNNHVCSLNVVFVYIVVFDVEAALENVKFN